MTPLPSITVRLDDRSITLPAGATLAHLLHRERREPAAVATALNGRFVPRDARLATTLHDGDVVLFFQPIVGG
ncbi:thiamine biosynthesis protein ThiS [Roseateles aquatilis]|uniref:Thiamine biosynthesis protein ThiS n=1 Tax=Roseateles aquatilis TaxID=431061 RepID=A0A246J2R1_9BURK|nr:sulfur carrier protein ThiS [Roseateles aquatilis]OWQ86853.1 thiamine biosynthesis protein ThiS [Roseateles aquatilis]